jgi:hypothetical protein
LLEEHVDGQEQRGRVGLLPVLGHEAEGDPGRDFLASHLLAGYVPVYVLQIREPVFHDFHAKLDVLWMKRRGLPIRRKVSCGNRRPRENRAEIFFDLAFLKKLRFFLVKLRCLQLEAFLDKNRFRLICCLKLIF